MARPRKEVEQLHGDQIGTNVAKPKGEEGIVYIRHNGQQFISGRTDVEGRKLQHSPSDDLTNWTLQKLLQVSEARFLQLFPDKNKVYEITYKIKAIP